MSLREIDVFDFDKTLYRGDSTIDYWLFNIRRRPWLLVLLPWQAAGYVPYFLGVWSLTRAKEQFLSYFRFIDVDRAVEDFWEKNRHKLNDWFCPEFMERESVVATASPEFLVAPACEGRGVSRVFGTRADRKTGKIEGENCKGAEKLKRIREVYPDFEIVRAFSDNLKADYPMLSAAREPYIVKDGKYSRIEL